jgi:hypothetical protein
MKLLHVALVDCGPSDALGLVHRAAVPKNILPVITSMNVCG